MMLTDEFIRLMQEKLFHRRTSKVKIMAAAGEQSLLHSHDDIRRIDFALKRIMDGQFGICPNCGSLIEEERLEIIPETPFCSSCAHEVHN